MYGVSVNDHGFDNNNNDNNDNSNSNDNNDKMRVSDAEPTSAPLSNSEMLPVPDPN